MDDEEVNPYRIELVTYLSEDEKKSFFDALQKFVLRHAFDYRIVNRKFDWEK